MNKIEKLIQELCPKGVPHLALEEVAEIVKGTQVNKETMRDSHAYPVYNGGIFPSGRHTEFNFPSETITVSQGGASAGFVNFVREPLWVGAHCYAVSPKQSVLNLWLFFVLKNSQTRLQDKKVGAGIPALDRKTLAQLKIPVPALKVQQEIVSILDKFTELEGELEAELEARITQLSSIRSSLFTAANVKFSCSRLGEVTSVISGWGFPEKHQGGTGEVPFYKVSDMNSVGNEVFMRTANNYVKPEVLKLLGGAVVSPGAVIFPKIGAAVATNKRRILTQPSAFDNNVMALVAGVDLLPEFLFHWFQTFDLTDLARQSGAVPSIRKSDIEAIQIPVPPFKEQEIIVKVLNGLQSLSGSFENSLPAEIQARRKQYEYYRNKLLTFKEFDAA